MPQAIGKFRQLTRFSLPENDVGPASKQITRRIGTL
jgi:hypothetical protein